MLQTSTDNTSSLAEEAEAFKAAYEQEKQALAALQQQFDKLQRQHQSALSELAGSKGALQANAEAAGNLQVSAAALWRTLVTHSACARQPACCIQQLD